MTATTVIRNALLDRGQVEIHEPSGNAAAGYPPPQRVYNVAYGPVSALSAAEVATSALAAAGYAVVKLPTLNDDLGVWAEADGPFGPRVCRGVRGDSFTYWPPDVARELAAALLAAADAAEASC